MAVPWEYSFAFVLWYSI